MEATELSTCRERAEALYGALETVKRSDDSEYVRLKDGSPEWMTDAVRAAHGEMFPDDWKYRLIERAAGIIAENDEDDWTSGVDQAVDVYTGQLTDWLSSHLDRLAYCDEAADEYGEPRDMAHRLAMGQYAEIDEIVGLLASALADDDA